MLPLVVNFFDVFLAALLVGSMFSVWLLMEPSQLSPSAYVALHQYASRALNRALPALGMVTIMATMSSAVMNRAEAARFGLLLATAACFILCGLITRFKNQPINAIVLSWSSNALPQNWMSLRNVWWRWHLIRLGAGVVGLSLLIASTILRSHPHLA